MKTFDFSTTKGIRAVADHLEAIATDAPGQGEIRIGHLVLRNDFIALTRAASLLRSNSSRGRAYQSTRRPSRQDLARNIRTRYHDPKSPIFDLDAVHLCGSPESALETIRRQITTQGAYMDPAALKSCQKAADDIAAFLDREQYLKRQAEEDAAAEARIEKATTPDPQSLTPAGTEVMVSHSHSSYMGKVIECHIGPHPILGKKHPTAIHTVEITHIHETRQRRYALYPIPKKQLLIPSTAIRILPPLPEPSPASSSSLSTLNPQPPSTMKTKTTTGILQLPAKFIASASTNKTREVITGVLIDAENRAVVATNGRILAKVSIPGAAPVRAGYITPELWKSATVMAKKGPVILDYVHGTIAGLPYPDLEEWGMNYPDWSAVVPDIKDPVFRTRIDPKLLLDCATALGYHPETTGCKGITLDFAADGKSPILLHVHGHSSGVIMPMADENSECGHGLRISQQSLAGGHQEEHSSPLTADRSTADLSTLQSERDALAAKLEATTRELTQARHRVTALETAAKHRAAEAAHSSNPTSDLPASSPSTLNSQPSTSSAPPALTRNGERNGIELRFTGKPDDATLAALKSHGFRWAPGQPDKPWYAKYTEERWVFATTLAEGKPAATPAAEELGEVEISDQKSSIGNPQSEIKPTTLPTDIFAGF